MTLLDIQNKLHQYYPDLEIVIWQKGDKGKLFVNNKQILKFNAEVLNLQLSNASDDFVSDTIKMFCNFIEKKYISRKNRFGKSVGRTGKNLTEAQIKDAISKTKSNASAARYLNVHINTYKKYASMYGLYELHNNKKGIGIYKGYKHGIKIDDIFAGKHTNCNITLIKRKLIEENILEEKCSVCGYCERRPVDGQVALILDFIDGNFKNFSRENLRLLCYNCSFNIRGKVNIRFAKRLSHEFNKETLLNSTTENQNKMIEDIWNKFNPKKDKKE